MLELKEEKFRLSKIFDIPTDDIDDSLVPLLVSWDKFQIQLEKCFDNQEQKQFEKLENVIHEIAKYEPLFKKNLQPIYCDKPSTAFFASAGKASVYAFCISIVVGVFMVCQTIKEINESSYNQLKELSGVVQYDAQSAKFLIDEAHLIKEKKGFYTIKVR